MRLVQRTMLGALLVLTASHAMSRTAPESSPPTRASAIAPGRTFTDCEACPLMAVIPAGEYEMGTAGADGAAANAKASARKTYDETVAEGNGDEAPLHRVAFARPFAVGVNEVTRGQFALFAAETGFRPGGGCQVLRNEEWQVADEVTWKSPGFPQTESDPVVCVSWREAAQYAAWLARKSGKPYRLLSEAEWEYLARRGGPGRTPSHDLANYGAEKCCARKVEGRDRWEFTAPVGSFPPDAFGLHDVLGNVWEWLEDCYHDSYFGAPADGRARTDSCAGKRIVRGGGYGDGSLLLRPAYRLRGPEDGRYATLGLRVARDLE